MSKRWGDTSFSNLNQSKIQGDNPETNAGRAGRYCCLEKKNLVVSPIQFTRNLVCSSGIIEGASTSNVIDVRFPCSRSSFPSEFETMCRTCIMSAARFSFLLDTPEVFASTPFSVNKTIHSNPTDRVASF